MITDKAWFKANPDTNFRVREPEAGEVNELALFMLPPKAEWDGGFTMPEGFEARVMAIRLPMRRVARVLAAVKAGDTNILADFALTTIALGDRLAVG